MSPTFPSSLTPFLEKLEARTRFTEDERKAIMGLPFHPRQVGANQDFVVRGEDVTHSCFVLDGLVGTFGQNRRGERQITSVFLSGDMVDLQTVVVPEALVALQALTTTTILQVPHSALREAAGKYPAIAEAFWRECVINAAILSEWVLNVGRRDARSRLAHLFCEIACRTGHSPADDTCTFPFPITQNQLADMLGLTPVHVNRTLKGLREDRLVEILHRNVEIRNWKRLAEIGDFDPTYLKLNGAKSGCQASASAAPLPTRMVQ